MITSVRSAGVYVRDQDRAKEFWTEKLGFDLIQDVPMSEEEGAPRWIEVAPPSRNLILVLFTPEGSEHIIGTFSNVLFNCKDVPATYEELKGRGVEFVDTPRQESWGWWASFEDPDGNTYGLGLEPAPE